MKGCEYGQKQTKYFLNLICLKLCYAVFQITEQISEALHSELVMSIYTDTYPTEVILKLSHSGIFVCC